jgi:hypothetical protein
VGGQVRAEVLWIPARPRLPRRDPGCVRGRQGQTSETLWALDADLAQAFDQLAHDHILAMLGTFPARGMVAQWLKAVSLARCC